MMDWEKNITIDEVIEMCEKYMNKEIIQEDLQEWWNTNIKIRFYLPIGEKSYVVDRVLNRLDYGTDFVSNSVFLEMYKFWYILLEYTNIDNTDEDKFTIDNYDLLFPNIYTGIASLSGLDYQCVEKILDNALNFTNVNTLMSLGNTIEDTDFKEIAKLNKNLTKMLKNPEFLKDLSDIAKINTTEEGKKMEKLLQEEAIKIVNKKMGKEQE